MGVHDGHRARKKDQFFRLGTDAFTDHELLELLLYYALPRQDTNVVAHALLERFGTLDALFSAPVQEIERVEGVGRHAAVLLALIVPLHRRIRLSVNPEEIILDSTDKAGRFFVELLANEPNEVVYMVSVNAKGKVIDVRKLATGAPNQVTLDIRTVVENALLSRAYGIFLSHNHPSGAMEASDKDGQMTLWAEEALAAIEVKLLDHVIVADGKYFSMRQVGLLR